jgi:CRISPR-associated endonuclease/helicase Cas3
MILQLALSRSDEEYELGEARLLQLWAKRGSDRSYHPLPCHLIDVAAVTEAIWLHVLPGSGRRFLAEQLSIDEADAAQWVPLLAGLHDLGKASPAFQYRWPELAVRADDLRLPTTKFFDGAPHGSVTAGRLPEILEKDFGVSRRVAISISVALGGHHGVIPGGTALSQLNKEAVGQTPWQRVRRDLTLMMSRLLEADRWNAPRSANVAALMVFAGLVSVADWIGSDETFFPYVAEAGVTTDELDLIKYMAVARQQAMDALHQIGWTGITGTHGLLSFNELFPGFEPNPLQRQAVDVAVKAEGRCLAVVEAPMGEGKTEAAFYLSDVWAARPGYRGSYTALPTQATSNQMFSRVRRFLSERYPDEVVNLQLLHGHASLSSEFELLRRNAHLLNPRVTDERRNEQGSVIAAEWFTYRKRGLLTPFGVGTVDQTLLAILQSRHVFVRLFGLFQKTIVFDEVHAYDTYMSALLERLLEWLAAIGSSAVILSATLPAARRDALLAAWRRGLGQRAGDDASLANSSPYPRVTWHAPDSTGSVSFATSPRSVKNLRLHWVDMALPVAGDPFPLGEQLRAMLADGGCVAVICNTVRRAQTVYEALKPYFAEVSSDGHPELDLIHARYLFAERQRREQRALIRFGKVGAMVETPEGTRQVKRPHRAVLVATQVIEQSLDLDFDLMVSDLAPVDLLLQRSGRLHRHIRTDRPAPLQTPVLWIGQPDESGSVPTFESGSAVVYDEHVLLRTWLAIQRRASIRVPEEVEELIEAVYDDRTCPAGAPEALVS